MLSCFILLWLMKYLEGSYSMCCSALINDTKGCFEFYCVFLFLLKNKVTSSCFPPRSHLQLLLFQMKTKWDKYELWAAKRTKIQSSWLQERLHYYIKNAAGNLTPRPRSHFRGPAASSRKTEGEHIIPDFKAVSILDEPGEVIVDGKK